MAAPNGEVRRVSEELLRRIVEGRYPHGLRLPSEVDLAAEFSCGRSTVREALQHLTALGVVRSRRGSGALVLDFRREGTPALLPAYLLAGRFDRPAVDLARELLVLRSMLAREAVRLAARYATPAALGEPRRILARTRALSADPVGHALNELSLFRALVVASGIWPAVWLANVFWAPMRELHERLAPLIGVPPPLDFHPTMERLLALIERRDETGAEVLIRTWLERVDAELIAAIERSLGDAAAPRPPIEEVSP
jgi:DNA-binding FadR family transcriptional regulator